MVASLEQTMHVAAARALAQQEAALEALRARTGTVLTAASLIASFLGGQAIARNGLNAWVVLRRLNEPIVARMTRHARVAGFALMVEVPLLGVGLT